MALGHGAKKPLAGSALRGGRVISPRTDDRTQATSSAAGLDHAIRGPETIRADLIARKQWYRSASWATHLQPISGMRACERLLRGVRRIMDRRRDRRARIWITELGWCDKGPRHRFCVGARKQRSLIRSSLALIRKERRRLRLRGFVYYSWIDGRPYAPAYRDLWGLHTGLLRLDGRAKPAFTTFAREARRFR